MCHLRITGFDLMFQNRAGFFSHQIFGLTDVGKEIGTLGFYQRFIKGHQGDILRNPEVHCGKQAVEIGAGSGFCCNKGSDALLPDQLHHLLLIVNVALPTRMEIEWRGVSFSYDKPVLKNVTARMDLTQNHIIRGENGAGKSTLIKLLLGMETPQSGEISVLGSATGQLDKTLFPSEIFYLPQKAPVFDLTVGQMLLAVTVRERAFAQRLSQLGEDFNEFCEKPLAEMSEGQRKKFYLALAFSGDATLLILDEPTNHLDDAGRKTLAEWIAQRGRGVVVISHDSVFEAVDAVCWKLQNGGLAYV